MAKKNGITKSNVNKGDLEKMAEDLLKEHSGEYFTLKKFFRALGITAHPVKMLCVEVLNGMLERNFITRGGDDNEFCYNAQAFMAEGVFSRTGGGRNFVDTDDGQGISVYDEDTLHALPGDRVKVALYAKRPGSKKLHGQVIEILERSERLFVGTLEVRKDAPAYLVVPSGVLPHDILVPTRFLKGGVNGDKAAVKVVEWPLGTRNPVGEVVEIFGKEGENDTEMHAILAEYGLPYSYPKEVEEAANLIDAGITAAEIAKREDFRETLTMTIDPRDAKDFDDAISIKDVSEKYSKSKNSKVWEIGVHIADVSHYVVEGGVIDAEAQKRATSVYLVDRTIPMLPERLCNGVCSLRPDEEKLTFSAVFDLNEDAEVLDYRIRHTVIRSARRFTYEEVQAVLEAHGEATECELIRKGELKPTEPVMAQEVRVNEEGKAISSAGTVQPDAETYAEELIVLNRLAKTLREKRFKDGAINFDREEVRFEIDETGRPLSVYFKRAKDANKLVEEFMLLANRTVAESVGKVKKGEKAKVLPYRIHDMPDPGKLENLGQMASRFGFSLQTQGNKIEVAKSLNKLLKDVKGKKWETLVENVSLRAMMKAKYSTYNIGHYGLAFEYYTHFTSPIRRYPDLMVHRLLTRYAEGEKSASQKKYEDLCTHSSDMEQLAAQAERSSIKYKQVEFMKDKIGEVFDAHISGVSEFGVFAEVDENKCEGFIPVRLLGNEGFNFDDKNFCLIGRQTNHRFTLGDAVRIKVASANLFNKTLDYEFVEKLTVEEPVGRLPFYAGVKGSQKGQKKRRKK